MGADHSGYFEYKFYLFTKTNLEHIRLVMNFTKKKKQWCAWFLSYSYFFMNHFTTYLPLKFLTTCKLCSMCCPLCWIFNATLFSHCSHTNSSTAEEMLTQTSSIVVPDSTILILLRCMHINGLPKCIHINDSPCSDTWIESISFYPL